MNELEDRILNDILKSYTSFEEPNWLFTSIAEAAKPYKDVVEKLDSLFSITEVTDENINVSFVYLLDYDGLEWKLFLSMVGKYYALFRYNNISEYIDANGKNCSLSSKEQCILDLMKNASIESIPESLLYKNVPMNFSVLAINTSPTIFECLFEQY